jgi:hypothetical protein
LQESLTIKAEARFAKYHKFCGNRNLPDFDAAIPNTLTAKAVVAPRGPAFAVPFFLKKK